MIKSFKLPRDAFYYSIIDRFPFCSLNKREPLKALLIAKAIWRIIKMNFAKLREKLINRSSEAFEKINLRGELWSIRRLRRMKTFTFYKSERKISGLRIKDDKIRQSTSLPNSSRRKKKLSNFSLPPKFSFFFLFLFPDSQVFLWRCFSSVYD